MSEQQEDTNLILCALGFHWSNAVTDEPNLSMAINRQCQIQELIFFLQQDAVKLDEGCTLEVYLDDECLNKITETTKTVSQVGLVEQSRLYFKKAMAIQQVEIQQLNDNYLQQYNSEIVTFNVEINGQEQDEEIEFKLNVPIQDIIDQYAMAGLVNEDAPVKVRFVDRNGQEVCTDAKAIISSPPFEAGQTYTLFIFNSSNNQDESIIVQSQEQQRMRQQQQVKNSQIKKDAQMMELKQQSRLSEEQMNVLRSKISIRAPSSQDSQQLQQEEQQLEQQQNSEIKKSIKLRSSAAFKESKNESRFLGQKPDLQSQFSERQVVKEQPQIQTLIQNPKEEFSQFEKPKTVNPQPQQQKRPIKLLQQNPEQIQQQVKIEIQKFQQSEQSHKSNSISDEMERMDLDSDSTYQMGTQIQKQSSRQFQLELLLRTEGFKWNTQKNQIKVKVINTISVQQLIKNLIKAQLIDAYNKIQICLSSDGQNQLNENTQLCDYNIADGWTLYVFRKCADSAYLSGELQIIES